MLIRPIAHSDLDTLYQIAVESGPGFTSLMPDRDALTRKIEHSVASFNRSVSNPSDEHYLFVLEDEATGEIIGTTGIEAAVGHSHPLYHFHRNTVTHHSRDLGLRHSVETLTRCNHYSGCTEVCSLYLRPEFRRPNAGKLLSRVRFLFMGLHPERFSETVIAEMRGVSSDEGRSPFWDWMREHFVDMEFAEVTRLISSGNTDFIEELMPSHPLYTCLLSPEAQGVLSEVHEKTRPALHMLKSEGFRHKGFVDLFDGGPTVECKLSEIRSVQESEHWSVEIDREPTNDFRKRSRTQFDSPLLVTNTEIAGFRATVLNNAITRAGSRTLFLTTAQAEQLNLRDGSVCRVLPLTSQTQAMPTSKEHTRAEVSYAQQS